MPERYKDEIEEILKQAENVLSEESTKAEAPKPRGKRRVIRLPALPTKGGWQWPTFSPGKVMLAALAMFVLALVLHATTFVWVGLGLFVVAYVMFFLQPKSGSTGYQKRWRGRLVEEGNPSLWDRFRRLLRG